MSDPLALTLWCATLSTLLVMIPGTLLAYALARFEFPGKRLLSALAGVPLVLPPTAVGFALLWLLSQRGPLGFDPGFLLTWKAVVLACAVMSFPLVVRTARATFEGVDPRLESLARTLGRGRMNTFFTVTLPLAARGLTAAAVLGFTRAVGEFGATVTVAGNIPGQTRTLSTAIFSAQQAGNEAMATNLSLLALALGLLAIWVSEALSRRG